MDDAVLGIGCETQLFRRLKVMDKEERTSGMSAILSGLRTAALQNPDCKFVESSIYVAVRLSRECPFDDVRQEMRKFLDFLQEQTVTKIPSYPVYGCSSFIPSKVLTDASKNEETKRLFIELFVSNGRITHLEQVLGILPDFLRTYMDTYNFLFFEDGPLPVPWRFYIAIIAISRFRCTALIELFEHLFLEHGGYKAWLEGVNFAPKKLQDLLLLNRLLAHQPWLVAKDHIASLAQGKDSWSLSELVQCIVILVVFHAWAGVAQGLGVTPEVDLGKHMYQEDDMPVTGHLSDQEEVNATFQLRELLSQNVSDLIKEKESVSGTIELFASAGFPPNAGFSSTSPKRDKDDKTPEESRTELKSDDCSETRTNSSDQRSDHSSPTSRSPNEYSKYCGDYEMRYEDFDVKSRRYRVFKIQDYNWKDHGFPLADRFYHGVGPRLDAQIDLARTYTENMFNETPVNTEPFRRALWEYVHRLFGICNDDYQYSLVNLVVNRRLKEFTKRVTCHPDLINRNEFLHLGYDLQQREKVHMTLVTLHARMQASLLYALHAVMRYTMRE
eukprot:415205_1